CARHRNPGASAAVFAPKATKPEKWEGSCGETYRIFKSTISERRRGSNSRRYTGGVNWLLAFVPITIALHYFWPGHGLLTFAAACLAIVPLAGWLGKATEHLASSTSDVVGGLLNATFGNAAELIIGLMAI